MNKHLHQTDVLLVPGDEQFKCTMKTPVSIIGKIDELHCYTASDAYWNPDRTSKFDQRQGLEDARWSCCIRTSRNALLACEWDNIYDVVNEICELQCKYPLPSGGKRDFKLLDQESRTIKVLHRLFGVSIERLERCQYLILSQTRDIAKKEYPAITYLYFKDQYTRSEIPI